MNRNYFEQLADSGEKAGQYYNSSREYYYHFAAPWFGFHRNYSGKEIVLLRRIQLYSNDFDLLSQVDQYYLMLLRIMPAIKLLYGAVQRAVDSYHRRLAFTFRFDAPRDLFQIPSKTYNETQLMNIEKYTQQFIATGMRFHHPIPTYWLLKKQLMDEQLQGLSEAVAMQPLAEPIVQEQFNQFIDQPIVQEQEQFNEFIDQPIIMESKSEQEQEQFNEFIDQPIIMESKSVTAQEQKEELHIEYGPVEEVIVIEESVSSNTKSKTKTKTKTKKSSHHNRRKNKTNKIYK